ncbi:MAG: phosphate acetyltransferase [Candidatus Omnitrophica bacterium]|nr:phosphate acetyltransferase [Candidatus Omnitrophota bacterium]HOX54003.1 phosphate acetyltransferase [Candidatus Omnitrophota bacterium]
MEDIIKKLRQDARSLARTIVLPEMEDQRVRAAVEIIRKESIANVVLLSRDSLDKNKVDKFSEQFYQLRKHKNITPEDARKTISDPLYYAAMMARNDEADGFVAGASHTTSDVARAAIYCLGVDRSIGTISSSFIMILPHEDFGEKGVFLFADCGIIPDPSAKQLASIAVATSRLGRAVLGLTPRVAMLSYSTKGSAEGEMVDKVKEATRLAREMQPDLIVDGELQVDSAVVPEVATIKNKNGIIKGDANILIFPDLEAGNIGYKLINRLAKAVALGPLLQGLNKPCSDLSRGCTVDEIVDCVAVTAIRAAREK